MERCSFGKTKDGREASLVTMKNENGMTVSVTDYGATLVSIRVPEGDKTTDVVLGYDSAADYEKNDGFLGAVIGRNGNRIGTASFTLNGRIFQLEKNEKENNLHSGSSGFDKRIWNTELLEEENSVRFTLHSPDGDEGFPGNLDVTVTYTLTEENGVRIHYQAKGDQDTIVNLTNHSYFNLAGHDRKGTIEDHVLWVDADFFTPTDADSIPTGELRPVKGTPFDFTVPKRIGLEIDVEDEQLKSAGGYDHNMVLNRQGEGVRKIASVSCPARCIAMDVYSDLPGVQFYAGNGLGDTKIGKGGAAYERRRGFCLETQFYPDAIHHAGFPSPVLKAGEDYDTVTEFVFHRE